MKVKKQMDKLEEIFNMQGELDQYIKDKRALTGAQGFTAEEWIQKKCLALLQETSELLNEVNFKWWKNPKPVNTEALHEELIDILHFWVSMCVDAELSADKVYEIYRKKNHENHDRQDGKSKKAGYHAN